jgi:RimJ/RimL family protein N-acetyltransferase
MSDKSDLEFQPYEERQFEDLVAFVAADTYPYNGTPQPTAEQARAIFGRNIYKEIFWILLEKKPVGILHYQDLGRTAEIHIRLHTPYRGKGIGRRSIQWFTQWLFSQYPEKQRLEAWVRHDNGAMRAVLRSCGYVLEAKQRQVFPTGSGQFVDNAGYAILRSDWEQGTVTPVIWDGN